MEDLFSVEAPWLPGSFTKNFSWGARQGLKALHENIRIGFAETLEAVPREEYRRRVASAGRPDLIPINFFLFNEVRGGASYLKVDELVFQALSSEHSSRFDSLALFAFNFGHAGQWSKQKKGQRYPALWAAHYIVNRVARDFLWQTDRVNAADIERYLRALREFHAETAYTKISTNLNFLYKIGGLAGFSSARMERWWVDAVFLAFDRICADRALDGAETPFEALPSLLLKRHFLELTGIITTEKTYSIAHLVALYSICGGMKRFDAERVRELVEVALPSFPQPVPNDPRPQGALHPTNPRILKSIPRECSELARSAGFEIILADDLETFDADEFVRQRAADAVDSLQRDGVKPIMTPEQLHALTRGE